MKKTAPTTSILINNYNNARFIRACVESALAQTVPADEVIVYDDGSTDGSVEVLREFGDRIALIEGTHDARRASRANQAEAVWRAFERASGEWIFLLDGDDVFLPHKIETVLGAVAGREGVSLVQSPMRLIDGGGRDIGGYRDSRFHHADVWSAIYEQNDVDFFYPTSAMVAHRRALAAVLPLDMSICPALACDTRIGMLMPLLGEVVTIDEPLAKWRRHTGSYISALGRSRWFQARQTMRRVTAFNASAGVFGVPPISLWKNQRLRRQLMGALLPAGVRHRLRGTAAVFHGEAAKAA